MVPRGGSLVEAFPKIIVCIQVSQTAKQKFQLTVPLTVALRTFFETEYCTKV